jgi:hypothetical protein
VETLTGLVLGNALTGDDRQFSRCGAMFTDAVQVCTGVAVLRLRYLLRETTDQFAEEVVMAAFRPAPGGIQWLEPIQQEAIKLMDRALPRGNMPPAEAQAHVSWALASLEGQDWHDELVAERVAALKESHGRLRTVVGVRSPEVIAHTPPDILGLYVMVPSGAGR